MAQNGDTFGSVLSKPDPGTNAGVFKDRATFLTKSKAIRELAYKAFIVCAEQNILVEAWLPDTVQLDVNAHYDAPFAQGIGAAVNQTLGNLARFAGMSMTTQALTAQVWQGGSEFTFSLPLIFQAESSGVKDVMKPIKDLLKLTMPKDPSGGGLLEAPGPRLDPTLLEQNGFGISKIGEAAAEAATAAVSGLASTAKTVFTGGNVGKAAGQAFKGFTDTANAIARPLSSAIVNSVRNNISLYVGQFQYFASVVITDVSPTFDVVLGPDKNPLRASVVIQFKTFFVPTDKDIETMFPSATEGSAGTGSSGLGTQIDRITSRGL